MLSDFENNCSVLNFLRYIFSTLYIFYVIYFLRYIFSTLYIFYAIYFLRYIFSTLHIFYVTYFLRYIFSMLHIFYATYIFSTLYIFRCIKMQNFYSQFMILRVPCNKSMPYHALHPLKRIFYWDFFIRRILFFEKQNLFE